MNQTIKPQITPLLHVLANLRKIRDVNGPTFQMTDGASENHTEIIRRPFLSGTDAVVHAYEHGREVEYALMFGKKRSLELGDRIQTGTGGVTYWIKREPWPGLRAVFDHAAWNSGGDIRYLFVTPERYARIAWKRRVSETMFGDEVRGLEVEYRKRRLRTIQTPNCYGLMSLLLDPNWMRLAVRRGCFANLVINEAEGEHEFISDVGLDIWKHEAHATFDMPR